MKRNGKGFTIVELLTAIAIIAILISILIPSLITVRNMAKGASQKAQFMAIETGLMGYRNDFGDYPQSFPSTDGTNYLQNGNYCGSQKLAEAMVGLDLMGFHPDTAWRADGRDQTGVFNLYYPTGTPATEINLKQRKGHYIELEKANVFRLGNSPTFGEGLFVNTGPNLAPEPYVICDVFGIKKMTVGDKIVKAGTPILYFKANTTSKILLPPPPVAYQDRIYNLYDNYSLMKLGILKSDGSSVTAPGHPLVNNLMNFYDVENKGGVRDSRMKSNAWPHRPDTYILISAGLDGEYGTADNVATLATRLYGKWIEE